MPAPLAAAIAALAALAAPEKQSWDSVARPEAYAEFLPRSAAVEVDGQARGRGSVTLDLRDPKRTYRIRVSADGFDTAEATVEAGKIVHREAVLALTPAGLGRKVDPRAPSTTALAADALWKAGRVDDAADYAELSLRVENGPLANRVLGDVWRRRGDRDRATRHYTMYLSLSDNPSDGPEIREWLLQPRPGDITIPAK